ncbi:MULTISPECIES: acyl-homoserine-lactone synthase [Variovorax]|uniref:acyl-homoserine-lactone synthase n=1 Tax=Variovorax TaxID=34072 RepID=UPI00119A4798|nr:acyl-homoserine-lactone synthase [Variovorax paradoxus]MDR6521187.1 N-acyl-L-homoserine lactone synthetase [Variovorax paradoxus]
MEIITGTADSFSAEVLFDMARYRHRVFVEKLGWDLDTRARFELDEFDRKDTAYLIARNDGGKIVGTGRLLPTHRPYLLATVFPELLGRRSAPCSPKIWELSRFAAMDLDAKPGVTHDDPLGTSLALEMLSVAMRTVAQKGARRLVSVSPLGVERILRQAGLRARRLGPPMRIGRRHLFACAIDVDTTWRPHPGRQDGANR